MSQVAFLRRYLSPDATYVEIGCGDAAVTRAVAPYTREAVGVDVTPALVSADAAPPNFRFVRPDGVDLALPAGGADVVYSNQLVEHLHPDDMPGHLAEVHRILKPGGIYICSTPNRITRPHDISGYFGYHPTGFHLREYDHGTLSAQFRAAGFRNVRGLFGLKGVHGTVPVAPVRVIESILHALPRRLRISAARARPLRSLAGVMVIGRA